MALRAAAQCVNTFMTYIALARKWRPRTFSELVGQDHINKALINSLNQQRLHHAYLFTGTRGVGKTSVARLLAKAMNCEQGISAKPCLTCDTCQAIEQGRFIDLIEVDAASRTRVEDTRELLDNVQYTPTNARFKIYLIDEVHMLSQHSFNALLKTLEEPPAHVKFILATTDPQKLPVTVLSRCLQFNLKHLQPNVIAERLTLILDSEPIGYDVEAISLLAMAARGSMRDALSLLDQVIAGANHQLSVQDVRQTLGYTQQDYALQILQALAALDCEQVLTLSRTVASEGGHFRYVLDEMLNHLHEISIAQHLNKATPLLTPSADIRSLSQQLSPEDTQLFYQMALKGSQEMFLAPTMSIGFEMTLLRMYAFRPAQEAPRPPMAYQSTIESRPVNTNPSPVIPTQTGTHVQHDKNTTPQMEPRLRGDDSYGTYLQDQSLDEKTHHKEATCIDESPKNETPSNQPNSWSNVLPQLKLSGLALSAAEHAELISHTHGVVVLSISKHHHSIFTSSVVTRLEQSLTAYFGETIRVSLNSDAPVLSSPIQEKQLQQQKQQSESEASLESDPFFQQLQQEFSANIVKNSISPKDGL